MEKIIHIQLKEKIKVPRKDDLLSDEKLLKLLKDPRIQPKAVKLYEFIFRLIAVVREIKNAGFDLSLDHETVQRRKALLLEVVPQFLMPIIQESDEMNTLLGKDFLAYARKRCERRLNLLESLLNESDLAAELALDTYTLKIVASDYEKSLSYYQSIRAKERKFAKIFCFFPILTILRLNDVVPAEREKFMHDLLVRLKAPRFGDSYEDGAIGISEREELVRIREWDRESVGWFQSL